MTELVIVADDLTGAADSAALLTGRGRTSIVLEHDADWPTDEVLSVDTDSRHRDADVAAARVAETTRRAVALDAQVVKKIDSTLRGNVAAELRAMADVLARQGERVLVVVAPAFPATGRTTRGGVVHVGGQRLDAHGSDGDVVSLLECGGLGAGRVATDASTTPEELAGELERAHGRYDAVVVDGDSDDDLATVVAASRLVRVPLLLAGSGGLTRPLARPDSPDGEDRSPDAQPAGRTPALVVVGSYSQAARAQREALLAAGLAPVLLDGDTARTAQELRRALATGAAVLSPVPDQPVDRSEAPRVAAALADAVTVVLDAVGTLVATGGETARAVLTRAGVSRLLVTGEVEPGVVRARVPERELDVVTKAGAFGDPEALLRCLPHLPSSSRTNQERTTP